MRRSLIESVGVRASLAGGLLFVLAALFVTIHADLAVGLAGYLGACVLGSLAVTAGYACLLGVSGWAFLTGFVVNAGGQLTFAAPDLEHLVLLLVASVAASAWRERRGEHHRDRRDAQRSRV